MTSRAQVFCDKRGNRFIVPSYIVDIDGDVSGSDSILQAMTMSNALRGEVTLEKEWLYFERNLFPHVSTELISSAFLHGAATVYMFAGPIFDEIVKEDI